MSKQLLVFVSAISCILALHIAMGMTGRYNRSSLMMSFSVSPQIFNGEVSTRNPVEPKRTFLNFPPSKTMILLDSQSNPQDRSHLSSEERAAAARCQGILHACSNWMALHSTKMRIILFKQGRWCTDDDLKSKACYHDGLDVGKDIVLEIPGEGEPLSAELWELIKESCPFVSDCPKPERYSSTEATSVYDPIAAQQSMVSMLASAAREHAGVLLRSKCCAA